MWVDPNEIAKKEKRQKVLRWIAVIAAFLYGGPIGIIGGLVLIKYWHLVKFN